MRLVASLKRLMASGDGLGDKGLSAEGLASPGWKEGASDFSISVQVVSRGGGPVVLATLRLYSRMTFQVLSYVALPRKAALRGPMSRAFCEPAMVAVVEVDICIAISREFSRWVIAVYEHLLDVE